MELSLTLIITIITGLVSYRAFTDRNLFNSLMHYPYIESRQNEYHRFVTSGFVHGDWAHLLINLFVFYQFGSHVENQFLHIFGDIMGRINFLMLYILGIIFADIPTFIKHKDNQAFRSVGASGAVSAIMFAYILFAPWNNLWLYGIIPIPGIIAAVLYVIYSSYSSRQGGGRIDHDAHLYGAIFGFLFTIVLKPSIFTDFMDRLVNNAPF